MSETQKELGLTPWGWLNELMAMKWRGGIHFNPGPQFLPVATDLLFLAVEDNSEDTGWGWPGKGN